MSDPTEPSDESRVVDLGSRAPDPFSGEDARTLLHLLKATLRPEGGTNTGTEVGVRTHLVNKEASRRMRDLNATHATCLDAKSSSSLGMGHREQEIYDALDPLCRFGWQDVLDAASEDFWGEGDGFVEVVWDPERTRILAVNQLDGALVNVVVEQENNSEQIHYQVTGNVAVRETVAMAAWGDMLNLKARYEARGGMVRNGTAVGPGGFLAAPLGGRIVDSEVIHLRQPTARDVYQGYPDWMSATPFVELVQAMVRHEFDFHFNRGVPEILATFIGGQLKDDDWTAIKSIFSANQGIGNHRKTGAIRLTGSPEHVKVQIDKLVEEGARDYFGEKVDSLAMLIATAHGVPPILANILLPGKIGASNEGPNALLLFQKRKLGQAQKRVSRLLASTLGSGVELNSPDGAAKKLTADLFLGKRYEGKSEMGQVDPDTGMPIFHEQGNGFRTVLDGMTLGAQDALARMKEPIAGSGRDPADGLLGGADDRKKSDPKRTR
jgi:hypothetical protein